MISSSPLMSSNTYSYSVNCQIQSSIYDWFGKKTADIELIRLSALGIYGASSLVTLISRICGAIEIPFAGIKNIFISPVAGIESLKIGLTDIFVEIPKQVLRIVCFPIEFTLDGIIFLCDPRYFTIEMNEHMKVLQIHTKTNTVGSEKFSCDQYDAYNKISYRDRDYHEKSIWYIESMLFSDGYSKTNNHIKNRLKKQRPK